MATVESASESLREYMNVTGQLENSKQLVSTQDRKMEQAHPHDARDSVEQVADALMAHFTDEIWSWGSLAAAAIAAYNAYLRERATDNDVVEAAAKSMGGGTGQFYCLRGAEMNTAILDAMLGKEDDHDS